MSSGALNWWLRSDAGLGARIALGAAVFAILAAVDLARRGRAATRWREYLFLLISAVAAMIYGLVNDRIASSISWEYFYYGKDIAARLGPHVPPEAAALRWEACKIGLKATWSAGLIVGVALLIANNPRRDRPQLSYRRLLQCLGWIIAATACGAVMGACLGSQGYLNWTSRDLAGIWREGLFRPHRFLCVYGMNLGGYAAGLFVAAGAMMDIHRTRLRRSANISDPAQRVPI